MLFYFLKSYNGLGNTAHIKYGRTKSFIAALKKSDIINFKFHDLRHTFASSLMTRGANLNDVRVALGHKSIRMTLRYAHLSRAHNQQVVDVLDKMWAQNGHKAQNTEKALEAENLELIDKSGSFSIMPR